MGEMTNVDVDLRTLSWRGARFWKPLEIAACCLTAATWFGAMGLWMYYDATRRTTPNQTTGQTYPQNTHGSIVYLNRSEETAVRVLIWAAGVSGVVAVGVNIYVRPFRRR